MAHWILGQPIRSVGGAMATSGELCSAIAIALGVPFETAREHLRNIRRAGMISFKGYGRGAAGMTPLDAARLLITVAGSSFVKDSLATLEGFGGLKLAKKAPRPRGMRNAEVTMEAYLADLIQSLIDDRGSLPPPYSKPAGSASNSRIGLKMMSVVSERPDDFPRAVAVFRFFNSGTTLDFSVANFSSSGLSGPTLGSSDYARQLQQPGLLQTRAVPAWVLAEIAHTL
jgi:hypothetical protein